MCPISADDVAGLELVKRIDGIVAIIMALGRAMLPEESTPSYQVLILGHGC